MLRMIRVTGWTVVRSFARKRSQLRMTTDYQTRIIGFCEDQIFFRAVVFRMIAAMMPASNEPANVPSFAPFTGGAPSKASMAMNNDMVNPIPASHAYPSRDLQARPLGSFAIPDFTATN